VIKVDVTAHLSQDGRPPKGNAVEDSIKQCVADAVEGSFDEYPRHLRRMLRLRGTRLAEDSQVFDTYREVRFSFGLPAELFPADNGGLQLLVNLLAGDMFPMQVRDCRWSNVRVLTVELPPALRDVAVTVFRAESHDIAAIRTVFGLTEARPLLAFSLKPRVGPMPWRTA
jgi:ribulose 1,5-bisphosphate carboxylase large subunit-like protein